MKEIQKIFLDYEKLPRLKKLENTILIASLFFIFKISFPTVNGFILTTLNEALMFLLLISSFFFAVDIIRKKSSQPLTLILNSGILITGVYFLSTLEPQIFTTASANQLNLAERLILVLLNFVFVTAGIFSFAVFRELFFLKQKKNPKFYFNVMLSALAIIFFVRYLISLGISLSPLLNALSVVVVILFSINSIRVAWIAFLSKKEKKFLLLVSVILSTVFGLTYSVVSSSGGVMHSGLNNFSAGFQTLFGLVMLYGTIYFGVIFFTALFHLPTAEAFEKKANEISSLANFTNLMTDALDFKDLAESLTKQMLKLISADVAWLFVNRNGNFTVEASSNLGLQEAEELTSKILSNGRNNIPSQLTVLKGKAVSINTDEAVKKLNFETLILAPLRIHNEINGCLFIGSFNETPFDEDDRKTVKAFTDYAAVALENSLLIQESIEKERLEKELEIARDIQHKIIPSELPHFKNWEISASFVPAFEVGGDYYDFFIDGDNCTFFIADVSGKGISAAFVMAELKGIFESLSRTAKSTKQMLSDINTLLNISLQSKEFVTASCVKINTATGNTVISRAGHTPALLVRNGEIIRLLPKGIGIGMNQTDIFENNLEEKSFNIEPDDLLFLFTDGLTDAQNKYSDFFGLKRIEKILIDNVNETPNGIAEKIIREVTLFSKDTAQRDDITFVIFKRTNE